MGTHFTEKQRNYIKKLAKKYSGNRSKIIAGFVERFDETISTATVYKVMKEHNLKYATLKGWQAKRQKEKEMGIENVVNNSSECSNKTYRREVSKYYNYFRATTSE